MASERDTQFKEFAKLLWQELLYASQLKAVVNVLIRVPAEREEAETIIAQRAYDLMEHIMMYAPVSPVPDMTEWPEIEEE